MKSGIILHEGSVVTSVSVASRGGTASHYQIGHFDDCHLHVDSLFLKKCAHFFFRPRTELSTACTWQPAHVSSLRLASRVRSTYFSSMNFDRNCCSLRPTKSGPSTHGTRASADMPYLPSPLHQTILRPSPTMKKPTFSGRPFSHPLPLLSLNPTTSMNASRKPLTLTSPSPETSLTSHKLKLTLTLSLLQELPPLASQESPSELSSGLGNQKQYPNGSTTS